MKKQIITKLNSYFVEYAYIQEGIEYWLARDLQQLLRYAEWRNFLKALDKAKDSCKNSGGEVSDHFVDVNKMVRIGQRRASTEILETINVILAR